MIHIMQSTATPLLSEVRTVFATGRTRSAAWRIEQLHAIETMCTEAEPRLVQALAADLGRPPLETWLGEIAGTVAEAEFARKHLRSWMRRRRVGVPLSQLPGSAWYQAEPLGVALIIGPWNYPFGLVLSPLVAAVAAGNCAVLKPSELAPATSALIAELVPQYLDADAIRVVEGGADVTQDLLAQGFDHAFFTGGTDVGRKIMAAAAATLTPVTLELGGKSPVLVTADADIDVAARRIAWIKLLNSGQTCIAPDYVIADRSVATELTDKIVSAFTRFRSGADDVRMPIVNDRQYRRLTALIDSTTGRIVADGRRDDDGLLLAPTVIVEPGVDDPVMTDEIFGPILPILVYDDVADAVAFVNARPKPLGLYVFSRDRAAATALVERMPSGGAVINHVAMHYVVPRLPFGGVGASGMGSYHGKWGFDTFSHRRPVLSRPTLPDPRAFYPPQSERAIALIRKVF